MKLKRFALVVPLLAALIGAQVHAQSSVTIYGVADAGVDVNRAGSGTGYRVISGGSQGSEIQFRPRNSGIRRPM